MSTHENTTTTMSGPDEFICRLADRFTPEMMMESIQELEKEHPETATKLKELLHSDDPEKLKKMMALMLPILDAKTEDDTLAGTTRFMLRRYLTKTSFSPETLTYQAERPPPPGMYS